MTLADRAGSSGREAAVRALESSAMTDIEPEEDLPPVAHVVLVYNGPVAPHWEMQVRYGDQKMLDDFWNRVNARLLLLPKHDPQFRRNRERVNRDAERELIICDWDLGEHDAESTITAVAPPPGAEPAPAAEPVEAEVAAAPEPTDVEAEPAVDAEPVTEEVDTDTDVDTDVEAAADTVTDDAADEAAVDDTVTAEA